MSNKVNKTISIDARLNGIAKEWRSLDRLSASRMFLEHHEALSALSDSITLRFKLKRMGLAAEDPISVELLALVDALGYQKMLANQPVATRFSAVKRPIAKQKIHE